MEFELLRVKLPVIFLGTVGFSAHRDGRQDNRRNRESRRFRARSAGITYGNQEPTYGTQGYC